MTASSTSAKQKPSKKEKISAVKKTGIRRVERHIVAVRFVAASRIIALVLALLFLPTVVQRAENKLPEIVSKAAAAIENTMKEKKLVQSIIDWIQGFFSPALFSYSNFVLVGLYVLWIGIVYFVVVFICKFPIRKSDEENLYAADLPSKNNGYSRIVRALLIVLIGVAVWRVMQDPWPAGFWWLVSWGTMTDGPRWVIGGLAVLWGVVLFAQPMFGVRFHRAAARPKERAIL